jgi:diadenosine hexaphosphate hydrolase (ATP-forming)
MTERHFAAGGVIIKREGTGLKVLLIKDSYGHWTWPKGHTEEGETPEETAVREISEETGLKELKVLELLGKQEYYYTLEGKRIFKTVHVFLVEASGDEPFNVQTEEIEEARWFDPEEALDTIEYKGSKDLLEKGLDIYE